MRTILAAGAVLPILLGAAASFAGTADEFPPNAVPGHCYQHVMTAPITETYQDREIDIPEHQASRTIPAVYGEVEKQVVVRPGRIEHYTIAPTYRTVTETEVIRPESSHDEVIPAQYDTVSERVMVREAHTEWRRGYGPVSDPDMPRWASDRDIVCLIEVPALYRNETRQVLRTPEQVIHHFIPAEVRTRTREVIDQPAREEQRDIPPIYSMVKERVVVQPERVETYTVPAVWRIVTKTRVVTPGHYEWREFACRKVRHLPPPPSTDGERGALDPKQAAPGAAKPVVLAQASIAGRP